MIPKPRLHPLAFWCLAPDVYRAFGQRNGLDGDFLFLFWTLCWMT